jgi:hypothetical protein
MVHQLPLSREKMGARLWIFILLIIGKTVDCELFLHVYREGFNSPGCATPREILIHQNLWRA